MALPRPPGENPTSTGRSRNPAKGDRFAQDYFSLLVGQYEMMGKTGTNSAARAEADRISRIPKEKIEWADVYRFELAILRLEPLDGLRRKAWILRDEYGTVLGRAALARYLASRPPDPRSPGVSEAELRADLVKLQEELNWTYTALWVQEDFRRRLARGIVAWGVAAVIAGLVLVVLGLGVRTQGLAWRTWAEVVIGGVAGGVVSTLRRIQTARLGRNVDLNLVKLEQGKASIYVSPFLGAVFAGVLCLLFAAGLLKGAVFPEMDTGLPGIPRPSQGIDEAKLLVWSFVAGFAEKLVPNRLDQLARQAETDEPRSQASAASTEAKE